MLPYILWQKFSGKNSIDTQDFFPYPRSKQKQVLINQFQCNVSIPWWFKGLTQEELQKEIIDEGKRTRFKE
jgi:hypothetical protein